MKLKVFVIVTLLSVASCKNGDIQNDVKNKSLRSIEVIYFKGAVETQAAIHCGVLSNARHFSGIVDTFIVDTEKCSMIINQIPLLKPIKVDSSLSDCDVRMECKIKYANGDSAELCIGRFNCIVANGVLMKKNDSLSYLIRTYAGYYNYFSKVQLSSFSELSRFGMPPGYKYIEESGAESSGLPIP